jgi:hypothetical protein
MAVKSYVKRYARRKLTGRLIRAVPWVGGVVALATIDQAIRAKGLVNGSLHSVLDAIPYVGAPRTSPQRCEVAISFRTRPDLRKT